MKEKQSKYSQEKPFNMRAIYHIFFYKITLKTL